MKITETPLPGVMLLEPRVFGDERGFFLETYRESWQASLGGPGGFVQDNHSRSSKGVLRGLHYQLNRPQGKLVRVTRGRVFDVAVDIRLGSPHFGRWFGVELDDVDHRMLYIPPGFAHGFVVLSEQADFVYKCTEYYDAPSDRGIAWDDPELAIAWPLDGLTPQISAKDATHPPLGKQELAQLPRFES